MRVTKKQLAGVERLLRKRPRTAGDLIKHAGGEYLHIVRKLSETQPVLTKRIWDNGFKFVYWIRPQKMGKNWKVIYSTLKVPYEYNITVTDFDVHATSNEV